MQLLVVILVMCSVHTNVVQLKGNYHNSYYMRPMHFTDDTCTDPNGCSTPSPQTLQAMRDAINDRNMIFKDIMEQEIEKLKKYKNLQSVDQDTTNPMSVSSVTTGQTTDNSYTTDNPNKINKTTKNTIDISSHMPTMKTTSETKKYATAPNKSLSAYDSTTSIKPVIKSTKQYNTTEYHITSVNAINQSTEPMTSPRYFVTSPQTDNETVDIPTTFLKEATTLTMDNSMNIQMTSNEVTTKYSVSSTNTLGEEINTASKMVASSTDIHQINTQESKIGSSLQSITDVSNFNKMKSPTTSKRQSSLVSEFTTTSDERSNEQQSTPIYTTSYTTTKSTEGLKMSFVMNSVTSTDVTKPTTPEPIHTSTTNSTTYVTSSDVTKPTTPETIHTSITSSKTFVTSSDVTKPTTPEPIHTSTTNSTTYVTSSDATKPTTPETIHTSITSSTTFVTSSDVTKPSTPQPIHTSIINSTTFVTSTDVTKPTSPEPTQISSTGSITFNTSSDFTTPIQAWTANNTTVVTNGDTAKLTTSDPIQYTNELIQTITTDRTAAVISTDVTKLTTTEQKPISSFDNRTIATSTPEPLETSTPNTTTLLTRRDDISVTTSTTRSLIQTGVTTNTTHRISSTSKQSAPESMITTGSGIESSHEYIITTKATDQSDTKTANNETKYANTSISSSGDFVLTTAKLLEREDTSVEVPSTIQQISTQLTELTTVEDHYTRLDNENLLSNGSFTKTPHLYIIENKKVTYESAKSRCNKSGGRLASARIRNSNISSFLANITRGNNKKKLWIGLDFLDGRWVWSDGINSTEGNTIWDVNQPNNNDEQCAALNMKRDSWKIHDYVCNNEFRYLCEK